MKPQLKMKQFFKASSTLSIFLLISIKTIFAQSVIWSENFETPGHSTRYIASSDGGFRDGSSDYFFRTNGSDIGIEASSYTGYSGNYFWAAEDTDDDGGDGNDEQTIQFTGINISGYSNISLSGLFGVGNNNAPGNSNFDSSDYIKVNYSIDGSSEINGLWFRYENHGDNSNEPMGLDANFDGYADQTDGTNRLGSNLQLFTIPINTGTILNLSIKIFADADGEEIAFDDFILKGDLTGTTVPAISSTITTLNDFEYMENYGPSSSKSFYVYGSNLTSNLIVTPPASYEISIDGVTFQSSNITLIQNEGIASSTIHVRLKNDLPNGTYNAQNIILSSTGAENKMISCNGYVTAYVQLPNAWINEFHYDNDGSDVDEFVEVVIENSDLFNLSDFTMSLYNGSDGLIYKSETLNNFNFTAIHNGYSFYLLPIDGIQNGPDGIGLSWQGYHIQLLSYEGSFKAKEGPAVNKYSSDILIEESTSEPIGISLQLKGSGYKYNHFIWKKADSTPGNKSFRQEFAAHIPAVPFDFTYILLLFFLLTIPVIYRFFKLK